VDIAGLGWLAGVADTPRLGTGPAGDASRSHRQRTSTSFGPAHCLPMSMAGKGLDSYTRTGPKSATGPAMVRGALNELSWSLLDCTCAPRPRKALMRLAAMVQRHSDALGADHRRVFRAIEDHADPPPTNGVPRALEYPCFTRLGWGELACPMYTRHTSRGKSAVESSERQPRTKECSALTGHVTYPFSYQSHHFTLEPSSSAPMDVRRLSQGVTCQVAAVARTSGRIR